MSAIRNSSRKACPRHCTLGFLFWRLLIAMVLLRVGEAGCGRWAVLRRACHEEHWLRSSIRGDWPVLSPFKYLLLFCRGVSLDLSSVVAFLFHIISTVPLVGQMCSIQLSLCLLEGLEYLQLGLRFQQAFHWKFPVAGISMRRQTN